MTEGDPPQERRNHAQWRVHWNSGVDVLGTVRDTCKLHPMVHDYRMSEAIENLSDLISDQGAALSFWGLSRTGRFGLGRSASALSTRDC